MSEWAAVREIDGVTLKVRVPVKALAQLMNLARTAFGGPEPELEDVASPMVWGWDRDGDCTWRSLNQWLSESIDRLVAFEGFLSEVALDFLFKSNASSEKLWENREDLQAGLKRLLAQWQQQNEEQDSDSAPTEMEHPT